MTSNNKGRSGGDQATPKTVTTKYFSAIVSWVQTWIVTLAVWGWLPIRLAKWVLRQGGHHED